MAVNPNEVIATVGDGAAYWSREMDPSTVMHLLSITVEGYHIILDLMAERSGGKLSPQTMTKAALDHIREVRESLIHEQVTPIEAIIVHTLMLRLMLRSTNLDGLTISTMVRQYIKQYMLQPGVTLFSQISLQ